MPQPVVTIHSIDLSDDSLRDIVFRHLPDISPRLVLVKPNWVSHEKAPGFPIGALVTGTRLIAATIEACLRKYPESDEILVADAPIQDCEWERLMAQTGMDAVAARYGERRDGPRVVVRDLRQERFVSRDGFLTPVEKGDSGDPRGYREVVLNRDSFLDPVSDTHASFRVSDYDAGLTARSHNRGRHQYLLAASVLAADLLINLPKMKTHQKAGITGALKNLVGTVGQKAYLVHYRRGSPRRGGDEFAPDSPGLIRIQVRIRQFLQKRSRFLFTVLGKVWRLIKGPAGIETNGSPDKLDGKRFYSAGGAWYGNDTVWRMIYDLNRIVHYADSKGEIQETPQREYVAICDGLTAGEGNGPLQPLPVNTGVIMCSCDPFAVDTVMARLMGMDYHRIPQLYHQAEFGDDVWGAFDPATMPLEFDGCSMGGVPSLRVLHRFIAPPGWKGHIEREEQP